jgi:hypothetical protein
VHEPYAYLARRLKAASITQPLSGPAKQSLEATVLSLAQFLQQQPASAPPCLVEPGLLSPQGILFVDGEQDRQIPVVANLALWLAAGDNRTAWIPDSKTPNGVAEVPLSEIAAKAS